MVKTKPLITIIETDAEQAGVLQELDKLLTIFRQIFPTSLFATDCITKLCIETIKYGDIQQTILYGCGLH